MVPSLTVHTFLGGRPEVLSKVELWKHIPKVCDRPVKSAPIPPGATQRLFDLYGPFHYYNYDDRPTCTRFTFGSRGKRLQVSIWQATVRPSRISVASIVYHCTFQ